MNRFRLAVTLVLVLSVQARGQNGTSRSAATTFRCTFSVTASVDMDGELPRVSTSHSRPFELIFDQVNAEKRTARFIGNAGVAEVVAIAGGESITLLESTSSGTIQVTVIYDGRNADGRFKAVHSRHTAAPGGIPIASQMYGACRALT